jgi:signal transduction histidine kinase/PAS domain-containing protein
MQETPAARQSPLGGQGVRASMNTSERRRAALMLTRETPATGTHLTAFLTRERSLAGRYGIAMLVTLVACGATGLLAPQLDRIVFMFLWPAVLFAALIGGFGPAALSSVLAVLFVHWLLLDPAGSPIGARDVAPAAIFLVTSLAMSSVANGLRVARARAADATEELHQIALELEEQATELEQQLEESQSLQEELEQTSSELADRTLEAEASSAFSRGILASITDPFVVHDAEWRFTYINDQAFDVFQHSARGPRGSLIGAVLWDVYPDIVGTDHEREMRRAATERIPVTYEAYYAEAGTWSVMSCYPLPDGGLATQWRDVTARRRAEETARYLARASEVLGNSLDYETTLAELAHIVVPELAEWCTVHVTDPAGGARQVVLAHADPEKVRWAEELNRRYPPDASVDQGVPRVLRTGQAEIHPEITDEMLLAGARDEEHRRLILELGLRSAIIVPLVAHGRILGALSLLSVRTGRRFGQADLELAQELARRAALAVDNSLLHRAERQARLAADEANMAKMQFLAVMSHELRTPLNAIGGYAELMRLGIRGPVTEEQVQDLDRIASSQRNLLGLINDILNFAKLEAGHLEFRTDDVPLKPLLEDIEALVAPQLRSAHLAFGGSSGDDSIVLRADREKVRQIVLNLLGNAIKFTPAGGRVAVSCTRQGDRVRVEVTDTGIGIAADRLQSVFDPFVQLDRTLTSQHEGTGLGLAISRDLARAMHGDIEATSELGKGSTFSLVLPAAGP